jgi:hypothetical protein
MYSWATVKGKRLIGPTSPVRSFPPNDSYQEIPSSPRTPSKPTQGPHVNMRRRIGPLLGTKRGGASEPAWVQEGGSFERAVQFTFFYSPVLMHRSSGSRKVALLSVHSSSRSSVHLFWLFSGMPSLWPPTPRATNNALPNKARELELELDLVHNHLRWHRSLFLGVKSGRACEAAHEVTAGAATCVHTHNPPSLGWHPGVYAARCFREVGPGSTFAGVITRRRCIKKSSSERASAPPASFIFLLELALTRAPPFLAHRHRHSAVPRPTLARPLSLRRIGL